MDVVLITGANKGIGYEVARQLAGRGMRVLLGARDKGRGQKAAEALQAEGLTSVEPIEIDVTSQASIDKAAAFVGEHVGALDVLINNAGIAADQKLPSDSSREEVQHVFDTNFFGVIAVTQAYLPLLRKSSNGRIVNVSSGLGSLTQHSDPNWQYGFFNNLSYCSSKTALNAFSVFAGQGVARLRHQGQHRRPGIHRDRSKP